jgi:hypothetical protein
MLIFLSDGRLGNQIFQYSFLKTIAKKNESIICLNMNLFFGTFDLDKHAIWHISNPHCISLFKRIMLRFVLIPLCKAGIISYIEQKKDGTARPLPEWSETRGVLPFVRYVNTDFFQAEPFFDQSRISDLHIKEKYLANARSFLSGIPKNAEKVFIHIRRGDYLHELFEGEPGINLPQSYYEKAIDIIRNDMKNPFFILLSDDPLYIQGCFRNLEPKIISDNTKEVDLAIMTLCDAGIISNSSYSWWGAYLMKSKKHIIAPKYWYGWKKKVESHPGIQPTFAEVIAVTDL